MPGGGCDLCAGCLASISGVGGIARMAGVGGESTKVSPFSDILLLPTERLADLLCDLPRKKLRDGTSGCTPISPNSPSLPKKVLVSLSFATLSFDFLLPNRLPAEDGLDTVSFSPRTNGGLVFSTGLLGLLSVLQVGNNVAVNSPTDEPE